MHCNSFEHDHPALHTPAIWHPSADREGFAVVLFRRSFTLRRARAGSVLWVSASERFELFLDGKLIARGPSRSDPMRWGCVRVVLPGLSAGRHVLAARAWHFGRYAGVGQLGGPAFFMLCAQKPDTDLGRLVAAGPQWLCWHDTSRTPIDKHAWGDKPPYYVVGCGERIDGSAAPWGWEKPSFRAAGWEPATVVCKAAADPWGNLPLGHWLRPDPLPQMTGRSHAFASGNQRITVPARSSHRLVLDAGQPVNAYLSLTVSGGRGATIDTVCAEAPYRGDCRTKGHRDRTDGCEFFGHRDRFLPDGGRRRTFSPLWFRSLRYLQIDIRTRAQPLTLESVALQTTGFPLKRRARITVDPAHAATVKRILDVSHRTIELCSHETFFDCPHYEQAQFPGDSRIQAIYHYVVCDEDRLARKAIDDFHASRLPDGMLQCRYPSRWVQIIPTFGLYWVAMLDDFRLYRGDVEFLRPYLPAAGGVLEWFTRRLRPDGMLGFIEHAPFIDWAEGFKCGNAPQDDDGGSAILTLLLARACQWLAAVERACGQLEAAGDHERLGTQLRRTTLRKCWRPKRGLLSDTARGNTFSQHAQIEAILAGAWPTRTAATVLKRALSATDLTSIGTHYYRYYLLQALKSAGLREMFFDQLTPWTDCLRDTGLKTWPETDRPNPRSDCHAWSVGPAIELYQSILSHNPARPKAD